MSSSIIDLKTLGKPLTFDGATEKWASWSFKFEAWCGLLPDVGTSTVIELMDRAVAATSDGDVMINAMGAESATIAQNLYYILVQVMGGRGLMIVKKAERGNGLLIWRRLKQEYEDGTGHRAVAMLMGIMTPNWPKDLTARGFSEKVDEWEADLDRYERQTTEMISDAIKVAVVLKNAPHEVQQALRMQLPTIHDNYQALRSAIQLLARGLTEYSNRGNATGRTDDAMEVDQIFYSKGGHKGTGKQNEKGKSKNTGKFVKGKTKDKSTKGHGKDLGKDGGKKQFDGTCYVCNKWGHMGRDCWHAVVSNTLTFALDSIEASCFDAKLCVGRLLSRSCCLAASGPRLSDEARRACGFFTKNYAARAFPFPSTSSSRGTAEPDQVLSQCKGIHA